MRRVASILAAWSLAAALLGCGPKRPPELSSATSGQSGSRTGEGDRSDAAILPAEPGPDINTAEGGALDVSDVPMAVDVTGEGGPLDDVYFDFDRYDITDETRLVLDKHAAWLRARPTVKVTVEGHCDQRGTVEYNLALGDKRARAVREYLVGAGIPGERMAAISLGKERPKDPGNDEAAWARNRRAHFAVSRQ
jgi:peptidoglycan-associated lipoprotein